MNIRKVTVLASLLLLGAAGCQDLDVINPNAADRERALRTPGDIESLIGSSYNEWWNAMIHINGASPMLSVMSGQHSAYPANFGMVFYSAFPRVPVVNDQADQFYANWANVWFWNYRALAAARDGLAALETDPTLLGDNRIRAQAWGKFVQGLGHGSIGILFDRAFILDETIETSDAAGLPILRQDTVGYRQMIDAAIGYFDEAIRLSSGQTFTIPTAWVGTAAAMPAAQLVRMANTYKAELRAAVARTPEERRDVSQGGIVDWNRVLAETSAGITADWVMQLNTPRNAANSVQRYGTLFGWGQMDHHYFGMADRSGNYQRWLALPIGQRHPNLPAADGQPAGPFVIVTPDLRFPQGATLAEQQTAANRGTLFEVPAVPGDQWGQPGRGTWRWSNYRYHALDGWRAAFATSGTITWLPVAAQNMLRAEAHFRVGQLGDAAALVSASRTANGLSATDAAGTNASCVPRLPDGTCGGLLEMIKWERRLSQIFRGFYSAQWYFDHRGWGDLPEGTILQFPLPSLEAQTLGLPVVRYGGAGQPGGAPRGTYGF